MIIENGEKIPNLKLPLGYQLKVWKRLGIEVLLKDGKVVKGKFKGNSKEEEEMGSGWIGSSWAFERNFSETITDALVGQ